LRSELKRLIVDLQEEKNSHTTTKCRAIFATHILNGNRDERVKEFMEIDINHSKLSQIFKNANIKTS